MATEGSQNNNKIYSIDHIRKKFLLDIFVDVFVQCFEKSGLEVDIRTQLRSNYYGSKWHSL